MSSFIFNDFKKRYLNGEVPSADSWTFIPVADSFKEHFEFDDIRLDHYRSLSDFSDVSFKKNLNYFSYTGKSLGSKRVGHERYVDVLGENFKLGGNDLLLGQKLHYTWTKVEDDESFTNKPMYITKDNWNSFYNFFGATVSGNNRIENEYLQSGFYYIRSKDELEWFADHVNQNNKIIGVIGDNIQGVISKPIGYDEKHPFEGILDGNSFEFDVTIKAQYTDNGIVGVLGKEGIVRNFILTHSNERSGVASINCDKAINLNHIKNDGRDINIGMLVGRNYGRVEMIDASNLKTFNIYGCVPSVYSVTNKSEYKWNETEKVVRKKFDTNNENFMFLNSFCINSPGNICPYVGYFNEGKFADDAAFLATDMSRLHFLNVGSAYPSYITYNYMANWGNYCTATKPEGGPDDYHQWPDNHIDLTFRVTPAADGKSYSINYYPLGNYWAKKSTDGLGDFGGKESIQSDTISSDAVIEKIKETYLLNPVYYGFDTYGYYTVRGVGKNDWHDWNKGDKCAFTGTWIENYNSNLCQKVMGKTYRDNEFLEPSYEITRASMRPHPMARAAYNVGTIIGANYGTATHIDVSAIVKNTSNFVGFIGGLVGKQAYGVINNVSVYMDNQFNYTLGYHASAGDIVCYKQTPIFPECVTNYIKSEFNKLSDPNLNVSKQIVLDTFCKTYYDNSDESNIDQYAVNTATTITDDVITYKLRPIFVVGGLMGRYVPSYGTNSVVDNGHFATLGTVITNTTVLYKDNYYSTEDQKRAEDAFGALIGKVDYATNCDSFYFEQSMYMNNCSINALSEVGEPIRVYNNWFNTATNEWEPDVTKIDNTLSSLKESTSTRRYVGVYEIKSNVIDPVSYDTNSAMTADANGLLPDGSVPPRSKESISNLGMYWGADYPIDLSSHNGGIEISHNMFAFMTQTNDMTWTVTSQGEGSDVISSYGGPWDIRHTQYIEPNYDRLNNYGGYNKRNMACKIITMENCFSNLDNWIQLYDDYVNNWNYMQLPEYIPNTDFDADHLSSNKFNKKELYLIKKYWNRQRTNYVGVNTNGTEISASLHWDNNEVDFAKNVNYYIQGLLPQQTNPHVRAGTLNTFDGYTSVDVYSFANYFGIGPYPDAYYEVLANNYSPNRADHRNCYIKETNEYMIPKMYKKNLMTHFNPVWNVTPKSDITWVKNTTLIKRDVIDKYFYYTYKSSADPMNYIHSNEVGLEDAFAFTLPVTFTASNNFFGYCTPYTDNDYNFAKYNTKLNISLGEHYTPDQIRDKIETSKLINDKGQKYFVTTSVSSKQKFGGFLVVDSWGRNVMFMEDEQHSTLTGNVVQFTCLPVYKKTWETNKEGELVIYHKATDEKIIMEII